LFSSINESKSIKRSSRSNDLSSFDIHHSLFCIRYSNCPQISDSLRSPLHPNKFHAMQLHLRWFKYLHPGRRNELKT
jgi:hypothetical protein